MEDIWEVCHRFRKCRCNQWTDRTK